MIVTIELSSSDSLVLVVYQTMLFIATTRPRALRVTNAALMRSFCSAPKACSVRALFEKSHRKSTVPVFVNGKIEI